jgi:hypothetical protein
MLKLSRASGEALREKLLLVMIKIMIKFTEEYIPYPIKK